MCRWPFNSILCILLFLYYFTSLRFLLLWNRHIDVSAEMFGFWKTFILLAVTEKCGEPFLNQSFSAAGHQISWPEADAAPFPRRRVPGAASWGHGLCRRAHPRRKGQQRYMGNMMVWKTSIHPYITMHTTRRLQSVVILWTRFGRFVIGVWKHNGQL